MLNGGVSATKQSNLLAPISTPVVEVEGRLRPIHF